MSAGARNWSLRLARPGDAKAMADVERDADALFTQTPEYDQLIRGATRTQAQYHSIIAKGRSLTVECDQKIVGFAAAIAFKSELHLEELSVLRAYQRRGIGSGLVRALQADARNSGFNAITLETFRAVAWNAPFYAKLGFQIIDDLERYPRLGDELARKIAAGMPPEDRCAMVAPIQ